MIYYRIKQAKKNGPTPAGKSAIGFDEEKLTLQKRSKNPKKGREVLKKALCVFSRLKAELMQDGTFETIEYAHIEIFMCLQMYYNSKRLHSSLDFPSPMPYEKKY